VQTPVEGTFGSSTSKTFDLGPTKEAANPEANEQRVRATDSRATEQLIPNDTPMEQNRATTLSRVNGLTDSVMRTVVSSGNDALDLLFVAAHKESEGQHLPHLQAEANGFTPGSNISLGTPMGSNLQSRLPTVSSNVTDVWNACRFVKMGWFSAEEAVLYLDL